MRAELFWPAAPDHIWDRIRQEFALQSLADIELRLGSIGGSGAMHRVFRVFVGEGTFCPGFQLRDELLHAPVLHVVQHTLALQVPRKVFAAWMISPPPASAGLRPVDALDHLPMLEGQLSAFADRYRPRASAS